jgi:hypothetical protein
MWTMWTMWTNGHIDIVTAIFLWRFHNKNMQKIYIYNIYLVFVAAVYESPILGHSPYKMPSRRCYQRLLETSNGRRHKRPTRS